jgi:microsomal dipeptidase-like Zn-dependent dipeptidase
MLLDLHAHFPMHLLPDEQQQTHERMLDFSRRRWQAKIVALISRFANYQGPGDAPSVTEDLMHKGEVGALLSPLYAPFDEIDLDKPYGAPPDGSYTPDIVSQLQMVEDHVAKHTDQIGVAHTPAELDALIAAGRIALIHAIEGGLFLGGDEPAIRRNVEQLAGRGVAYVTIAHLFWRDIATNAPAIPFLPDWLYNLVFSQPDVGLSALGQAAVEAMLDHGVLIDITHMRERTINDTFALLERRAPGQPIPVIATHMACRLGKLEYCLTDDTIREVARRGGVLGLIMCDHFITDGLKTAKSYQDSFEALCRHIDHIHELTGSYDAIGFGSDLDGYIKPALPGLTHEGCMLRLQNSLRERYGAQTAEQISSGNALRLLRSAWTVRQPSASSPG